MDVSAAAASSPELDPSAASPCNASSELPARPPHMLGVDDQREEVEMPPALAVMLADLSDTEQEDPKNVQKSEKNKPR